MILAWAGYRQVRHALRSMPAEFLTDDAAAYGRYAGVPSQADLERVFFLDSTRRTAPPVTGCLGPGRSPKRIRDLNTRRYQHASSTPPRRRPCVPAVDCEPPF